MMARVCQLKQFGDHPRAGGGDNAGLFTIQISEGPSPRRRGRLGAHHGRERSAGTIPAQAGETTILLAGRGGTRDHPRAGGGDECMEHVNDTYMGPSPRRRGRLATGNWVTPYTGTIPAQAGETFRMGVRPGGPGDHPRAGGGDTLIVEPFMFIQGPSPRRRGRQSQAALCTGNRRTIPAQAGETNTSGARIA